MPLLFPDTRILVIQELNELHEIFGHSDFDGLKLEIGNWIVFDDGKISKILRVDGEEYHEWDEPRVPSAIELDEIKMIIKNRNAKIFLSSYLEEIVKTIKMTEKKNMWLFGIGFIGTITTVIVFIIWHFILSSHD